MRNFSITNENIQEFNERVRATDKKRYENNLAAIKLLKSGRVEFTDDEQLTLATFSGWGSLADVFKITGHDSGWKRTAQQELKEILTTEEYSRASESILNAHYTSSEIASVIWESVEKLGFSGGDILEPSCGNGIFLATCPKSIREKSKLYGVELDPLPSRIAQLLHPDSHIYNCGFESAPFDDNSIDIVISNVPFGNYKVSDSRYDQLQLSIHNYFLAKVSDIVRPGGYIAIITNTHTLDSKSYEFRQWLGKRLHLVSAIRLPNDTFRTTANTEVTTDILIFRKLKSGIKENIGDWRYSLPGTFRVKDWDRHHENYWDVWEAECNEWFKEELVARRRDEDRLATAERDGENLETLTGWWGSRIYKQPHCLLGKPVVNKLYGRGFSLASYCDNDELIRKIRLAIEKKANDFKQYHGNVSITKSDVEVPHIIQIPQHLIDTKQQQLIIWESKVYERVGNKLHVKQLPIELVEDFISVRKQVDKLIVSQSSSNDDELSLSQQQTREMLEVFEKRWGKVISKELISKLGNDSRYFLLRSLFNKDNSLTEIFSKRICRVLEQPPRVLEASDALAFCLNEIGRFDIEYLKKIMILDEDEIIERFRSKLLIYFDPSQNSWVLGDEYLSGNVVEKLRLAKQHEISDNITALEIVQPLPMLPNASEEIKINCLESLGVGFDSLREEGKTRLLSKSISVKLGTNWISPEIYTQFMKEVLKISGVIKYLLPPISTWEVDGWYPHDRTEFGTDKLSSHEILQRALNQQDPKVIVQFGGEIDHQASNEATEAARGKLELMKISFLNWIWESKERATELCKYYNENINVYAERKYDGTWLKLPGSNPNVSLRPWQQNAVARIIESKSTFLAHEVGLGKTLTMVTSVMECRRLGLAKKPLLVALNGTESQIAEAFKFMYPMSNVLVPSKLNADGRKLFTASIATGDYDCVIITHSQFFTLMMSSEYQVTFLNKEKQQLEDFLKENVSSRGLTKIIKKSLRNVESRIDKVTKSTRKDSHIDFEQLGIDMMLIDEIHQFKNLGIFTKIQNVRGIPTTQSQRAMDTYMKLLYVCGDLVDRGIVGKIVGSTGTMVSNTMAEIFNWQRMFQKQELEDKNLDAFDAWISQFGEAIASSEVSPSGEYRVITRFKSFQNIQVLRSLIGQFVDIATVEMVGNDILKRPTPKYIDVNVEPSEEQLSFLRESLKRSEAIRSRKVDPQVDNMLKVTSDLTKAALSMRLLGHQNESYNSKLHECSFNVWKIWEATRDVKGVQLVFCDFSTPKKDAYSVYEYIRLLLIELGVPANEIAFIHDHDNKKREKLFQQVNLGNVRVLLGSTGKLGTGCNVHKNGLFAIHHVDAPWRPSDIEQREGRGIRQGNGENRKLLTSVLIFRYITERLDALRWQTLQWKQEMINKFLNGVNVESINDCDQVVYSFDQVKSLATGNPLLIEESNLRNELNSLLAQHREHERQQLSLGYKISSTRKHIENTRIKLTAVSLDITSNPIPFWKSADQLQRDAIEILKEMKLLNREDTRKLFDYKGFRLIATWVVKQKSFSMKIVSENTSYPLPFNMGNFTLKADPKDLVGTVDKFIECLPDYENHLQLILSSNENELSRFESLRGRKFDKLERLLEIQNRLTEIDMLMTENNEAIGVGSDNDKDTEGDVEEWFDDKDIVGEEDSHIKLCVCVDVLEDLRNRPLPDYLEIIRQQSQ